MGKIDQLCDVNKIFFNCDNYNIFVIKLASSLAENIFFNKEAFL